MFSQAPLHVVHTAEASTNLLSSRRSVCKWRWPGSTLGALWCCRGAGFVHALVQVADELLLAVTAAHIVMSFKKAAACDSWSQGIAYNCE